jgi:hypothetical protein
LSKNELADLRGDVEAAFLVLEAKTGFPTVDRSTRLLLSDLPGHSSSVGSAVTLVGRALLQGQTTATLQLGTGTAQLNFTANRPGTPGNDLSVEIVQGDGALAVSVLGNVITITLAVGGSTAAQVVTAYNLVAAAVRLAQIAHDGVAGAGTVLVAAETNLAGGVGSGLTVLLGGVEQDVVAVVTDTSISMLVVDVGSYGLGDFLALAVESNGVLTDELSVEIVADPPLLYLATGAIDLNDDPSAVALQGESLLEGQATAALTLGTGTASLAFTANRPGTPGNDITVAIAQGAGALAVAVDGTDITVTLAVGGSTATEVKSAYDLVAEAVALAQVAVSGGGGGTVLITEDEAAVPLEGGIGAGFAVYVAGVAQSITDVVTDTAIAMSVDDFTGLTAGDAAGVYAVSNGVTSSLVSMVVVNTA